MPKQFPSYVPGYTGEQARTSVAPNPVNSELAGVGFSAAGRLFAGLAQRAGQAEDRRARTLGAEAGAAAGFAGPFKSRPSGTISGDAYNAAATDTFQKSIEINSRNKINELSAKFKDDPIALDEALTAHRDGVLSEIGDEHPDIAGAYKVGFSALATDAVQKAQVNRQNIIDANNIAATNAVLKQRGDSYSQLMRRAAGDAGALQLANVERDAIAAELLSKGPPLPFKINGQEYPAGTGLLTADQIQTSLTKLEAEGQSQAIMGWWERGPQTANRADAWYGKPVAGMDQDAKDRLHNVMLADAREADYQAEKALAQQASVAAKQREKYTSDLEIKLGRGLAGYADIETAYQKELLSPDQRARLTLALDDVKDRRAAKNATAEQSFKQGQLELALARGGAGYGEVESAYKAGDISDEAHTRYILALDKHKADTEKAQTDADKAAAQSALEINVSRGAADYPEIEAMFSAGQISAEKRKEMTIALDKRNEQLAKEHAALGFVQAAKAGQFTIDPKNADQMKAVDADFTQSVTEWVNTPVPGEEGLPPRAPNQVEIEEKTLQYVARVGVVPDVLQGSLRGQLRNGTPEQKIDAADMLEKFRLQNPALLDDFAKEDIERAITIADMDRQGIGPEKITEIVTENEKMDEATKKDRTDYYMEMTKPAVQGVTRYKNNETELKGALNTWMQRNFPGMTNPDMPPEMVGDYDRLRMGSFVRTRELGTAREFAIQTIKRTWALSGMATIDGTAKWAKSPPENYYSAPATYGLSQPENAEWMRAELVRDFGKDGIWDKAAGPLEERLAIVPDILGRTNDADGGKPTYNVIFLNSQGQLAPVVDANDPQHRPLPWAPDWENSDKKKALDKKAAAELNAARVEDRTGLTGNLGQFMYDKSKQPARPPVVTPDYRSPPGEAAKREKVTIPKGAPKIKVEPGEVPWWAK